MNQTPPTPSVGTPAVAEAVKATAPPRRPSTTVQPTPGGEAAKSNPSGVRLVASIEAPAHMQSMVGARKPEGALAGRAHSPLVDGPAPGITLARARLADLRGRYNAFLTAAAAAKITAEALLKDSETDADLRAVMQVEGVLASHLKEALQKADAFLDFIKPPTSAPKAPAAA